MNLKPSEHDNSKRQHVYTMLDLRLFEWVKAELISATDFLLYLYLHRFCDPKIFEHPVFPNNQTIRDGTGMSPSTIQDCLNNLERVGLITRLNHKKDHNRKLRLNLRVMSGKSHAIEGAENAKIESSWVEKTPEVGPGWKERSQKVEKEARDLLDAARRGGNPIPEFDKLTHHTPPKFNGSSWRIRWWSTLLTQNVSVIPIFWDGPSQ